MPRAPVGPVRPPLQAPIVPHPHRPQNDVRMFAAVTAESVQKRRPRQDLAEARAKVLGTIHQGAWYEDPLALGTLLIVFPPVGLATLWTSKRYSNDARWALTVMTGLTMCLGAAIFVAILALRS
jgi:hypothetical protein